MQTFFLNQQKALKRLNVILLISISCSFISHCVFLRALESDGIEKLAEIIFKNSFTYEETSRIFFHFLYQLPIVLFLKAFSVAPLYLIKFIYSISLLWLHILAFIVCYLILPKEKKEYLCFPLLGFVLGPMASMGLSIYVAFLTYSWIWAVAFIIHYSNLSVKRQKIFFIASISALFFSHEMMSYMAVPLVFFCFKKLNQDNKKNKKIIYAGIFLLIINSFLSAFFVFFPTFVEHRSFFIESLTHFYFFYKGGFYTPILSSFCVLTIFFLFQKFSFSTSKWLMLFITPGFLFFCIMNIVTPVYPVFENFISFWNEYDKRVWPVISLPFTLLIWWLFENKKIDLYKGSLFFLYCVFLSISLTGWRVGSDYRFYQYQTQLAKKLSYCSGYISWEELQEEGVFFKPQFLQKFYDLQEDPEEHIINASLFYSNSFTVNTLIQSHFKPVWLCPKSQDSNTLFVKNKMSYKDFIQLNCKNNSFQKIKLNRFDLSNFINSVKIGRSSCEKN